jgi:hypothetical protein
MTTVTVFETAFLSGSMQCRSEQPSVPHVAGLTQTGLCWFYAGVDKIQHTCMLDAYLCQGGHSLLGDCTSHKLKNHRLTRCMSNIFDARQPPRTNSILNALIVHLSICLRERPPVLRSFVINFSGTIGSQVAPKRGSRTLNVLLAGWAVAVVNSM